MHDDLKHVLCKQNEVEKIEDLLDEDNRSDAFGVRKDFLECSPGMVKESSISVKLDQPTFFSFTFCRILEVFYGAHVYSY